MDSGVAIRKRNLEMGLSSYFPTDLIFTAFCFRITGGSRAVVRENPSSLSKIGYRHNLFPLICVSKL